MRRYLVVAHKTLGGATLMEHLHHLREADPYCHFHLVVPEQHPTNRSWSDGQAKAAATARLDEILEVMASMRMGATGEVGDANPVYAVGSVLRRDGASTYAGIILSTLPRGISRWWLLDVPRRMATAYPQVPLTHLVAEETETEETAGASAR
jgi:GABA permease